MRIKERQNLAIIYALIILFCITFSQKIPGISQSWPFLYVGIFFLFIGVCYIFLRIVGRKKIVISGVQASLVYFIFIFIISLDVIINPQARNAFILNLILIHIFPIILVNIFKDKSINFMIYINAKIFFIFSFLQAIIAWLFLAGWSFSLLGVEYEHVLIWGGRLHGVMGEPTHFGLLLGVGLVSLLYLYRSRQLLRPASFRVNVFYVFLSLFFIMSILFSGTRNALVSTTLSLVIYSVFDRKIRKLLLKYVMVIIAPLVLLLLAISSDAVIIYLDILAGSLRFGDNTSESVRLLAIYRNLSFISEFDFWGLLSGIGYSDSLSAPTSFNQYTDILRNFGFTWLFIGALLMFTVIYTYVVKIKSGWSVGAYPFSLLIYSLSVFMFYSPMNTVFHIVAFIFIWSILVSFLVQKKLILNLDLAFLVVKLKKMLRVG